MLVYHFTSATHAIDSLRKRRLKASVISEMNDPFELYGATHSDPVIRKHFESWQQHVNSRVRILCFAKSWSNPVLWSHYADRHYGMCLGLEVPDDYLLPVQYGVDRLKTKLSAEERKAYLAGQVPLSLDTTLARRLVATKFEAWEYEDEIRAFLGPKDVYKELGLFFTPFSDLLRPRVVILGVRCRVSRNEVVRAIQIADAPVTVISTRLSFTSYTVVQKARKQLSAKRDA